MPLAVSLSCCSFLFEPREDAARDAGDSPSDAALVTEACGVFAGFQSDFTSSLPIPPWDIAGAEPLLVDSSANLQPLDSGSRGLQAQVDMGAGALTFRLGPHESGSLLMISVGGIQFHRNIGNRGVYFFDESDNTTTTIAAGGPYRDGRQELQVMLKIWPEVDESTGTNLAVQYLLADAQGQGQYAFEPARTYVSGTPAVRVHGLRRVDTVPILLHEMSCL